LHFVHVAADSKPERCDAQYLRAQGLMRAGLTPEILGENRVLFLYSSGALGCDLSIRGINPPVPPETLPKSAGLPLKTQECIDSDPAVTQFSR